MDLHNFMKRVKAALDRNDNDMFVCTATAVPLVRDWIQIVDLPILVTDGLVLLKFKPPRKARNVNGDTVSILSYHDGRYYGLGGATYREKDIVW
jgi:hypothetical protein